MAGTVGATYSRTGLGVAGGGSIGVRVGVGTGVLAAAVGTGARRVGSRVGTRDCVTGGDSVPTGGSEPLHANAESVRSTETIRVFFSNVALKPLHSYVRAEVSPQRQIPLTGMW